MQNISCNAEYTPVNVQMLISLIALHRSVELAAFVDTYKALNKRDTFRCIING
jgi:hypothetical protein